MFRKLRVGLMVVAICMTLILSIGATSAAADTWGAARVGSIKVCDRVISLDYRAVWCVGGNGYYVWVLSQANQHNRNWYTWYNGDGKTATTCRWSARPICVKIPYVR